MSDIWRGQVIVQAIHAVLHSHLTLAGFVLDRLLKKLSLQKIRMKNMSKRYETFFLNYLIFTKWSLADFLESTKIAGLITELTMFLNSGLSF